jgi:SIR2-like domain
MPAVSTLSDNDWNNLVDLIGDKLCTPFIGAGAAGAVLPLGGTLAKEWADAHKYPLNDDFNLTRVTQFLAIERRDPTFPKRAMQKKIEGQQPDFSDPDEPHMVLADLALPIYITTNYDSFMSDALTRSLERRHPAGTKHKPRRQICRWYDKPVAAGRRRTERESEPTADDPLVFHLHGYHANPESLVLTEDDYLNFLVRLSEPNRDMLPQVITRALNGTALLFVGYSLADWTFRVLFRSLSSAVPSGFRYPFIAVQLPPEDAKRRREAKAQDYLKKYFGRVVTGGVEVMVHFQDVHEFTAELRQRWEGRDGH